MNATDLAKSFAGFLAKHGTELAVVASTLQTLTDHIPVDPGTRQNISDALTALGNSAVRIGKAAAELTTEGGVEVVVSRADVEAAVAEYMHREHPDRYAVPTGDGSDA